MHKNATKCNETLRKWCKNKYGASKIIDTFETYQPPAPETNFYEIKPALLNLVMKEQFSGVSTDDAAAHLNNFVELCEMQKYKDRDGDIIKLKLFPFSLIGRAKDWLLSLPRNSIDSWVKCKDAFIGKYYPPAKVISLRSDIMKFKQFDNEHVAQAWERIKSLIKNCPTHGLITWMIIQTFYAGLNFLQETFWIQLLEVLLCPSPWAPQ
jgi:hypothetical protein